jgi:hypothetical protein
MDRYKAPRDKLLCLVNVKTMVENIVQLAASGGAGIGGEHRWSAPVQAVRAHPARAAAQGTAALLQPQHPC